MAHHPQKLMILLLKAVGLFLLIACFFIFQCLFDLDVVCSCRPGLHLTDSLFMIVPPLILTWIVILIESFYQKSIFLYCSYRCCNNICSSMVKFLIRYVCLLAVWASAVLLDGDWYFCLMTNHNSSQTGLPCREMLTYKETLIRAEYKNESLDIGFAVICGMFLVWNLFEGLKFCIRTTMHRGCSNLSWDLLCPPYYKSVYEDLLSEAVNSHLEEELKKLAEERAKQICKEHLTAIRTHEMPEQNQGANSRASPDDAIGINETVDIFDTWQKISLSYFYLMNENERRTQD